MCSVLRTNSRMVESPWARPVARRQEEDSHFVLSSLKKIALLSTSLGIQQNMEFTMMVPWWAFCGPWTHSSCLSRPTCSAGYSFSTRMPPCQCRSLPNSPEKAVPFQSHAGLEDGWLIHDVFRCNVCFFCLSLQSREANPADGNQQQIHPVNGCACYAKPKRVFVPFFQDDKLEDVFPEIGNPLSKIMEFHCSHKACCCQDRKAPCERIGNKRSCP